MLHVDVLSIVAPRLSSSKPEPASGHSALPPLGCWGPGHTCRPVVSRWGLEPSSQSHCGGEGGWGAGFPAGTPSGVSGTPPL